MGHTALSGVMRCGGMGTFRVSAIVDFSTCFEGGKLGRPSSSIRISMSTPSELRVGAEGVDEGAASTRTSSFWFSTYALY